ncbi:hypothetical protein Q5H93_18520 [Hymenobacter sp. ASUV-10]|uniref:Uncharacterized protein n=1 Tax=Hymenobacter aranciens TaxID=3063996 RepID=A0ABT9BJB9_9BACT|nr:hypothetical protein [Hymenobacter sp. ASUV-10]MDO7876746.1 hypothetical protein [Hymenobacter sp. ASUV-10]
MQYKLLLLTLPVLFVAARPNSTPPVKTSTPPATAPTEGTAALARFNLAPLWRMGSGSNDDKVHNGFFGYGYRRLELVFTSVQRDEKNPALYHVQGKDRRYSIVRSFSGTFTLSAIRKASAADAVDLTTDQGQLYTATGEFVLREKAKPTDEAYGTFRGKLAVDLARDANGRLQLVTRTTNAATRHGGFLLNGTWTDARTGAAIDVLVKNGMAVTYQVLQDFEFGGRSVEINPKYTRVGWDGYWSNEEWWAEKPVARR